MIGGHDITRMYSSKLLPRLLESVPGEYSARQALKTARVWTRPSLTTTPRTQPYTNPPLSPTAHSHPPIHI